jgi:spore coat protein U-like protein
MKLARIALLSAAAAALLAAADASAQTTSSSFAVTASVAKNCRIDAATDIAITTPAAPWDPTSGANPTATGTVTVRCTKGTSYTIDLNGGVYTDQLTHTNGADKLPFKLYASNCSSAFTPITVVASSRAARDSTICAGLDLADATLDPIAGDYSKTVVVDVTF